MSKAIDEATPAVKPVRQSGFDLLKIILFIFVVVSHFLNEEMGGGYLYARGNVPVDIVFHIIGALAGVAVPSFVLISGYFLVHSKTFCLKKVIGLYIMLISYRLICFAGDMALAKTAFSGSQLANCFLPTNYFVNFYAFLLVLAPFLNKLFSLKRKNVNALMIALIVLVLFVPTCVDVYLAISNKTALIGFSFVSMYGDDYGYTIAAFVVFYLLGAYIRFYGIKVKFYISLPIYLAVSALTGLLGYKFTGLMGYNNILVVVSSLSLFLLFQEIHIGEVKLIGFLSKCSLGVFIMHTTPLFTSWFNSLFPIEAMVGQGVGPAIGIMLAVVFSTVGVCAAADIVLRLAVTPIKRRLYQTKALNYNLIDLNEAPNNL